MDLRGLCSKLDMDALRAKIPPLPQIKLPKSLSKLRSRKIFRSSREDVNSVSRHASLKRKSINSESLTSPLGPPYINRTPNRISTISSLMNQKDDASGVSNKWRSKNADEENFYRSAGGIEDYSPSPLNQRFDQRISRPISPVKAPPIIQEFRAQSEQNIKMSFGERFQKSYKDVTEFKLKHLFAKKTVVHTDKIEINEYIHRFDEDRKREERVQAKIDQDVAENYRFKFKVSQQKSEESYAESPTNTPKNYAVKKNQKTVSELSGDESGMESSPPPRKSGIASTRFSRVRHTPLNMSLEEDNDNNDGIHVVEDNSAKRNSESSSEPRRPSQKPIADTLPSKLSEIRRTSMHRRIENNPDEESNESSDDYELDVKDENLSVHGNIKQPKVTPEKSRPRKSKSIKERVSRFAKQKSEDDEKKSKSALTPQQSEENEEPTKSDKPFDTIKQNFKRLQKSMKLSQHAQPGAESETDETNPENKTIFSKTQQFTERIKRFRSIDQVDKNTEEDENKEAPIHKISNKLHEWKMSIRKKVDLHNMDNDDDYGGNSPQKPVGSLMMKLKNIRSRKHDSIDDPDDDEEGGETYKESLADRAKLQLEKGVVVASQVPQRTMKKISETRKYFRRKQENDVKKSQSEEDEEEEQVKPCSKKVAKSIPRPPPPRPPSIPRPQFTNSSEEDTDDREAFIAKSIAESQLIAVPAARAVWTTRPILSDDTTDYDDELPRVLLHQDNSDIFESTLIIAVTRPISCTTTPIITELPTDSAEESTTDTKQTDNRSIPIQDKTATVLEMTPPTTRKLSKDSDATSSSRGHSRKDSIDSSSEDSWIKDIPRGPSIAVLKSVTENEEPWKITKPKLENSLYKTKSIDLFELQKKHGGVLTAFEDFDDELKNTPVVKIANEQPPHQNIPSNLDSSERESSEEIENPNDDNSSRITKISVHPPNAKTELGLTPQSYGNSRESLTGNLDDKDIIDSEEEDDNEEDADAFNDVKVELDRRPLKTPSLPPSKPPTPPPSNSPTPPPLPQRQPSIRLSKLNQPSIDIACPLKPPPPLPLTKPPIPPNRPSVPAPKIPDRNPSTTRTSKPLVKTASLRLAYSEQVNPEDVGKVNKLISRFEHEGPKQRPTIVPRKSWLTNESEEYSDEEDAFEIFPTKPKERERDTTPTNYPRIQKSFSIDSVDFPNNNEKLSTPVREIQTSFTGKVSSKIVLDNSECATPIPSISISSTSLDVNSNFSQPSSIYGSPLPYPSSLVGSTEVTPITVRKESEQLGTRRARRSLARDDEHFYSFDSDEENSYYSISSTSSNRYVVEL